MSEGNRYMKPSLDLLDLRAALQQHLKQQQQQQHNSTSSNSSSGSSELGVNAGVAFVRCPAVRSGLILVLAQALLLCPKQKNGFVSLKLMSQLALKVCVCVCVCVKEQEYVLCGREYWA
jgi:hypothetical protein